MKKILLIIFCSILFVSLYAQPSYKTFKWNETVTLDNSSNDTLYFFGELDKDFTIGSPWSLSVKYSTLTTSDVMIKFILSNIDGGESSYLLDGSNVSFTLDNVARFDYRGRATRTDNFFSETPLLFKRAAIVIITTSAVSGTLEFEFIQRLYYTK